jgi:hypothetical protein
MIGARFREARDERSGAPVHGHVGVWHSFDSVWLFPPTYALHLWEEYFIAGGFTAWTERALGLQFSAPEFVAWNSCALGLMCVGAWLAARDPKLRFIEIALAIAVLGNVAAHVVGSAVTWTYSPGLVTGVVLWIPLGAAGLRGACAASSPRERLAGTYMGLSIVLITLAVVSARTLFRG